MSTVEPAVNVYLAISRAYMAWAVLFLCLLGLHQLAEANQTPCRIWYSVGRGCDSILQRILPACSCQTVQVGSRQRHAGCTLELTL